MIGMEFLDLEKRTIAIAEVTTKSVFEELKKEKDHTISKEELHTWLHSGSPTAVLVGSWYDAFSAGRYRYSFPPLTILALLSWAGVSGSKSLRPSQAPVLKKFRHVFCPGHLHC